MKQSRSRSGCAAAAVLPAATFILALVASSAASAQENPQVQRGRVFAQTNCGKCHQIGRVGESPLPSAPPFRTLHERYPVEDLAESLAEGIVTGHPSMPQYRLDVAQIGDLIAYLKTLER